MRRPGFTLVEALVAVVLLAVGVLALAATGAFAAGLVRMAHREEAAARLASTLLDSLVHEPPASGSLVLADLEARWSADAAGAVVLVVSYGDAGRRRFHRWEAMRLARVGQLRVPPESAP